MQTVFSSLLLVSLLFVKVAESAVYRSPYTVSSDTILDVGDTIFQDKVTVDSNAYLAIISGYTHDFYSDLTVNGALYIGDAKHVTGITVDVIGSSNVVTNNGVIVVDHRNGTSAPTYDFYGSS